ncbi:hypothetical protein KAFR_0K01580 [Kazachstania africana CBS 2517]|uniref:Mitochondrial thiamine pyrophosphate carrier 1 n=1 Tax=Kazachstania africana (strain ATCC 22294 / BCRC 22015 / CBS 2517 / CECT 1963 / NBRC 1671 / NRRL Y-8276) TaxID=1071382 RepID=H2B1L2_KAZAF|nr:hypothetical protein KAFR_0K01580 [Kazachstania africana CBS 2517]CCF60512.1 hypothetical protein KAFR_0K01580 [Kazachstania africana CBS 2517]
MTRDVGQDHLRRGQEVSTFKSFLAGSVSGVAARTVTAPMDILKIRLQITPYTRNATNVLSHQSRVWGMVKDIVTKEGLRGFWKGNIPGSIMYVIYGGIQFSSYSKFNWALKSFNWPDQVHSAVVGALAGFTGSLCAYPFDVLRTRFVANKERTSFKLGKMITDIWRTEGLQGFYRGCSISIVAITISSSVIFGTYETIKIYCDERLSKESHSWLYRSLSSSAGAIGGITSKIITFPIDTVRRRVQIKDSQHLGSFFNEHSERLYLSHQHRGSMKMAMSILQKEGILGLYRGLLVSLCKNVPTTMVSLWTYEQIVKQIT